jgi:hypothetical protein
MTLWSIRCVTTLLACVLAYLYLWHDFQLFRIVVAGVLYYLIFLDRVPVYDWHTKKKRTEWCWVWQKSKRWELWEQEKEQFYAKKAQWTKTLDKTTKIDV